MDNLDKIKFKESIPSWLFKIDGSGKNEFKIGTRFVDEIKAYLDAGYTIEPQYTPKELEEKEASDDQNALDSQNLELISLLNNSEIHVSNDPPYPGDADQWKTSRAKWRTHLKSNTIKAIDPKPF